MLCALTEFEQEYFAQRVQIATKELEYMTNRFNGLTVAASVLAGFAFTALVELDIDTATLETLETIGYGWMENVYFVSIGLTIAFNLYIIMVATMSSLKAQRMALHGNVSQNLVASELPAALGFTPGMIGADAYQRAAAEPPPLGVERSYSTEQRRHFEQDDVHRAIQALHSVQPSLLGAFGASLCSFVAGAVAMTWIKTEPVHATRSGKPNNHIAIELSAIFVALLVLLAGIYCWVERLFHVRRYHDSTFSASASTGFPGAANNLREPLHPR